MSSNTNNSDSKLEHFFSGRPCRSNSWCETLHPDSCPATDSSSSSSSSCLSQPGAGAGVVHRAAPRHRLLQTDTPGHDRMVAAVLDTYSDILYR